MSEDDDYDSARVSSLMMVVEALIRTHPNPEKVREVLIELAKSPTPDDEAERITHFIDLEISSWIKQIDDIMAQ